MSISSSIVWLADIDTESEKIGKQVKYLAKLTQAKFPLLPGFVITNKAYSDFLKKNKLDYKIKQLLSTISFDLPDSLMQAEHHIKKLFSEAHFSSSLLTELSDFLNQLNASQATITLFETEPNGKKHITKAIDSLDDLSSHILKLWTEMFSSHAMWHRHQLHKDHFEAGAEIIIQKKINGDKTGTIITIDPKNHAKDKLIIITHHPHESDRYILSKKNLTIIDRTLKHYNNNSKLSYDEILAIAKVAKKIEEYLYFPQEITWTIAEDTLYICAVKPVSSLPQSLVEKKSKLPIARGKRITPTIGTGILKIIRSPKELLKINSHDVVVIKELPVKQLKQLKKARAIIITANHPQRETEILLRQYGIPTITTLNLDAKTIRNGATITVHGGKGEIYHGGFL